MGSRAVEAILSSDHVNGKILKKITRDFYGSYVSLAKDKFGSHVVERCWGVADIETKVRLSYAL